MLLVNPGVAVSTAKVFAGWDGVDRGALADGDPLQAASVGRNDLEPAARALAPEIDAVLSALAAQAGVGLVRMSGSGATCLALFDSAAARDAADAAIAEQRPDWWRLATSLR
jgi:4-diphosphocytidyl-2-C-methyl-D-erythritol kinase